MTKALTSVRPGAADVLKQAIRDHRLVFVCGNGGSAEIASNLANDCSVVEDSHQSLMHILAQYLRMSELPAERVRTLQF